MFPTVSQSHVPQRRLKLEQAHPDEGRRHSKAVAHRHNCTENRRPAAHWCARQQPHGTFQLRDTQPRNEKSPAHTVGTLLHIVGALPHALGALPITTSLNRAAVVPKSATSPNVCTPVTPGCEEPPPWGDSGLRLRTGRDTQQPCGCLVEPH